MRKSGQGTVPSATNDRSTVVQFLVEKVQLEMVGNLSSGLKPVPQLVDLHAL
jgi:hypothetical protein